MASGAIKCSTLVLCGSSCILYFYCSCISSTFAAKCHRWLLMWLHRAEMKVWLRDDAGHLGLWSQMILDTLETVEGTKRSSWRFSTFLWGAASEICSNCNIAIKCFGVWRPSGCLGLFGWFPEHLLMCGRVRRAAAMYQCAWLATVFR